MKSLLQHSTTNSGTRSKPICRISHPEVNNTGSPTTELQLHDQTPASSTNHLHNVTHLHIRSAHDPRLVPPMKPLYTELLPRDLPSLAWSMPRYPTNYRTLLTRCNPRLVIELLWLTYLTTTGQAWIDGYSMLRTLFIVGHGGVGSRQRLLSEAPRFAESVP